MFSQRAMLFQGKEFIKKECFTNCVKPLDLGLDGILGGCKIKR